MRVYNLKNLLIALLLCCPYSLIKAQSYVSLGGGIPIFKNSQRTTLVGDLSYTKSFYKSFSFNIGYKYKEIDIKPRMNLFTYDWTSNSLYTGINYDANINKNLIFRLLLNGGASYMTMSSNDFEDENQEKWGAVINLGSKIMYEIKKAAIFLAYNYDFYTARPDPINRVAPAIYLGDDKNLFKKQDIGLGVSYKLN